MSLGNPFVLQSFNYEHLESSLRTGDIVLFNGTTTDDFRVLWARRIARLQAILPCSTCMLIPGITQKRRNEEEPEQQCDTRGWLEWTDAAIVVQLVDKTETNPSQDPLKTIPYVFVVLENTFQIIPLRVLLISVAHSFKRVYCAIRQLHLSGDQTRQNYRLSNQLRISLRDQLDEFYANIAAAAQADETHIPSALLQSRAVALRNALDDMVPQPQLMTKEMRRRSSTPSQHHIALFKLSSCYFVLYTLYSINVLLIEPQAVLATVAIQESGCVEKQLFSEYRLGEEMAFYFDVK